MYLQNIREITKGNGVKLPGTKIDALILSVLSLRQNKFDTNLFNKLKENLSSFDRRCLDLFKEEKSPFELLTLIENTESPKIKSAASEINYYLPLVKNENDPMLNQLYLYERRVARSLMYQLLYEKRGSETKYVFCSSMSSVEKFCNNILIYELKGSKIIFYGKLPQKEKDLESLNKFLKNQKVTLLYLKCLNKNVDTKNLKMIDPMKNGMVIRSEDKNILVLGEKLEMENDVDVVCAYSVPEEELSKLNAGIVYTRFGRTKVKGKTIYRSLGIDEFGAF